MSFRLKWIITAPLVALLASACSEDVTQVASGTFVRATFDSTKRVLPTPNDLVLQAAPSLPAGATRTALFSFIDAGGFPSGAPQALNVINVPFELVVDGVTTTARSFIDPASVNSTTVAIVRVSGSGAPALVDPTVVATAIGALQVFPATGYAPGERYVAAVRGGPSGVKTNDGRTLSASSPIYLISNGVNLGSPETRPSTLTPQQVTDLTKLQSVLVNPLDWVKVPSPAACAAALGAPQAAFVEGSCWLPSIPGSGLPPADSQPVRSALSAVGLAFPVTEAISIQTFEIQ